MQFKGSVKDAKLSSRGIDIHLIASDDCSTDDLRAYFEEPVMVIIELIAPEAGDDVDGCELEGE